MRGAREHGRGRRMQGFTLLEVLLAMALIGLLAGGIFGLLWNVMDRRDRLVHATAAAQSAGAFFELLESDVACAIAGDAVIGAGISGDGVHLRLLSRRVWAPITSSDRDATMGDLQATEYRFDPERGVLNVRRQPAGEKGPGSGAAVQAEAIAARVEAVRIRYFDGASWVTSFDSLKRAGLPVAVEVAVWFERGGGQGPASAEGSAEQDAWDDEESTVPQRAPDRLRVICIADGPATAWKEGR